MILIHIPYSGFSNIASSFTGDFTTANSRVSFNGVEGKNAVLYRITTYAEISNLRVFGIKEGLSAENISDSMFDLIRKRYSGGTYDYYGIGNSLSCITNTKL